MVSNNNFSLETENGCKENSNYNGKEYNISSNNIKYNILPSLQNEDDKMRLADDINDCKAYNQSSCVGVCCDEYDKNEDEPSCGRLCRVRQKTKEVEEAAKSKKNECRCDYCIKISYDASNRNRKRKSSENSGGCGKKGGCCGGGGCGGGCSGGRGTSNRSGSCCKPKCKCKKCCPPRCCESCESCCGPKCCESCESCCGPKCCKPCCGPKSCKSCCGPKSCKSCCGPKSCKQCCEPKCKESKCCERNCALSSMNAGCYSGSTCCKTPGCTVHDSNRKPLFEDNSRDTLRKGAGKISKKKITGRADRDKQEILKSN